MSKILENWPKDITKQSVQRYLVNYYQSQNAPKHQELIGEGNRCSVDIDLISFPQSVVNTIMRGIASTDTTNRGLLVWHSVGSGKTCSATAVIDAFWETDKNIVFVTSVEAANSNPPSNFHKCASRFLPRFQGKSMETIKKEFDKRGVKFFTFAKLSHYLLLANPLKRVKSQDDIESHKNFLKNSVLIIDEVHNIFKPLPTQKQENTAVKNFLLDYQNPLSSNLKLVILTATPGDNVPDIIDLLNMIRDKNAPPIKIPDINNPDDLYEFETSIQGLISYFDMSKDYSKFPRIIQDRPVKTQMSIKQYLKYANVYNEEPNSYKNSKQLKAQNELNKYYKHARRYSNMLYELDKDMLLTDFSSKLPALLDMVDRHPLEKHYIYSSFYENRGYGGHGIVAIAKTLEKELGFTKLSLSEAKTIITNFSAFEKKPRYVLAISNELKDNVENLKHIVTAFNAKENARGEYIRVFLASQGYNEGVDLRHVRHVHIFEPLLTFTADKQTIGRAARYCSHSDLDIDRGEWNVKVHRYISTEPKNMYIFNMNYFKDRIEYIQREINRLENLNSNMFGNRIQEYKDMLKELEKRYTEIEKHNLKNVRMIDEQISQEALEHAREIMTIYNIMKKQAVDYLLFKEYHQDRFNSFI